MNIAIYCVIAILITIVGALLGMALTLYAVRPIIIDYRRSLSKRDIEISNYPKASEHKDADDDQAVVQYDQAEDYSRIGLPKKLKIRFTKFEKALVMQILEQEGEFKSSTHVRLSYSEPWIESKYIYLIGKHVEFDKHASTMRFNNNEERDAYLKEVVHWISEEQFGKNNEGMLKAGELCEVRDVPRGEWKQRKLITILPERFANRYIVEDDCDNCDWTYFAYARPIGRGIEPKIDGDIYTWEEK